jgi:carbon-monoxide dehydrogenase medium subunit
MYAFELRKAQSVSEAASILTQTAGKPLAGGQTLIATMKFRLAQPGTLVDLSGIAELKSIRREGDAIVIAAMTTHAEVAASGVVKTAIPALAALASKIGDRQVRNMGTIGGSIANNDPAACYPAAALGLNATIETNKRQLSAEAFFKGMYQTDLAADELITALRPIPTKAAYENSAIRRRVSRSSACSSPRPSRACSRRHRRRGLRIPQQAARRRARQKLTAGAAAVKIDSSGLNGDLHASPEYRAHLIPVLARARRWRAGDGDRVVTAQRRDLQSPCNERFFRGHFPRVGRRDS